MSVTSCPSSCKRCFVTIPSAIPVVRAYNSASAELKLTVCCVRDPCCEGCVSLVHNSATYAFACCWLTCPIAVCVHVHELWGCNDSIRHFALGTHFQVSHDTFHVHLVTLGRTDDFSCCLLHAVHDVCSFLARVQQFSHGCSVHCSSLVSGSTPICRPPLNDSRCSRCSLVKSQSSVKHLSTSKGDSKTGSFLCLVGSDIATATLAQALAVAQVLCYSERHLPQLIHEGFHFNTPRRRSCMFGHRRHSNTC